MGYLDQYTNNFSLIKPQDAQGLLGAGLPSGIRSDLMQQAGNIGAGIMDAVQNPYSAQAQQNMQVNAPAQAMKDMQDKANQMEMYKMAAGALQNLAPRQQMPSGNTAQIMRDQNQFRFAGMQQSPQQLMAQALRKTGG